MTEIRAVALPCGELAYIDESDWWRVCRVEFNDGCIFEARPADFPWHIRRSNRTSYAQTNCTENGKPGRGRTLSLHRLIAGAKAGEVVDHENCNGLDNCSANLRVGTQSQNIANRRPTHGRLLPKGVSVHKQTGRLQVVIGCNRKRIHVGLFDSVDAAATAYAAKAAELFGKFSRTDNPN